MAQTNQYPAKLCCTNFKNIRKYIRVQRGSLSRYYSFCHYLTLINDSFNRMLKGEKRMISGFLLEGYSLRGYSLNTYFAPEITTKSIPCLERCCVVPMVLFERWCARMKYASLTYHLYLENFGTCPPGLTIELFLTKE